MRLLQRLISYPIVAILETIAFLLALYAWLKDYRRWEGGFPEFYRHLRRQSRRPS